AFALRHSSFAQGAAMRKWLRLLIATLLIGLLGFYPLLAPPIHRIDKAHAELRKQGMAFADPQSSFDHPPGNYHWAVADNGVIRLWDVATGASVNTTNTVFAIGASGDNTLWSDGTVTSVMRQRQARYVTTLFFASTGGNTKAWISRHGTCTVFFDDHGLVSGTITDWGNTRIEPPWRKWWKKWFGE